MTNDKLEEIRAAIANEPEDSPARQLLAEIDRRDVENRAARRAGFQRSLQDHWGLSEPEALAYMAHADKNPGYTFEYERGACRKCDGDGRVMTSSGCFGGNYGECPTCHGSGVATRVHVPGFVYECTCHPEWWDTASRAEQSREKSHPRFHMHGCPKRRGRVEDVKPVAESEL